MIGSLIGMSVCLAFFIPAGQAANQVRHNAPQVPVSPDLIPYLHARSVVDFSRLELIERMPELKGMEFADSQDPLPLILQRVGENVEVFFRDFPNTTALENVYHEREEPGNRNDAYLRRRYHYVIAAATGPDELGFEEYRTNLKDELFDPEELRGAYLITTGHASSSIYFHPRRRPGCRFRYLGREASGRRAHLVAFAQDAEVPQPTGSINLVGIEITVMVQGVAWIDPESYQILRMRLDLLVPRKDVGLEQNTTKVEFGAVRLGPQSRIMWLPREVRIVVACRGWRFQNQHTYSQYRLFTVESRDGAKQIVRP